MGFLQWGLTAFYYAAGSGNLEVVNALLKAGADVNLKDEVLVRKISSFYFHIMTQHLDCVFYAICLCRVPYSMQLTGGT